MLQWTWTSWERVWRSALKQRRRSTLSPPSSFPSIPSWCACRWTKPPSPSGRRLSLVKSSFGCAANPFAKPNVKPPHPPHLPRVLPSVSWWPSTRECHQGRVSRPVRARSSWCPARSSLFTRRTPTCARRSLDLAGRWDKPVQRWICPLGFVILNMWGHWSHLRLTRWKATS